MKERVREAAFNLIGPSIKGKLAIDLFAGTGALGLEALSRGASAAVFIERHLPTIRVLRQNIAGLAVEDATTIAASDTYFWARGLPDVLRTPDGGGSHPIKTAQNETPWVVFCSPPYALYQDRRDETLEMISRVQATAPPESVVVVEADGAFDFALLPAAEAWDVRPYPPAVIGIWRKPDDAAAAD